MPRFDPEAYEDVHSRIKRFVADHPDGSIQTTLLSSPDDVKSVVVLARVYFNITDPMPRGMDMAQENAGGQGANATSWLENCSTSAIGRALANCGYSGDKRASRQEMEKVSRYDEQGQRPAQPFAQNRGGYGR